jgi:hypothetical protein
VNDAGIRSLAGTSTFTTRERDRRNYYPAMESRITTAREDAFESYVKIISDFLRSI